MNAATFSSFHAESSEGHYELVRADYPYALLTRRTFAMSADRILETRAAAPARIDSSAGLRWSSRPPC